MKIFFAPLQGYTDAAYRIFHSEIYPGCIDCYYTPFLRLEHDQPRKKDLLELEVKNPMIKVVPQIIVKDILEFRILVNVLRDRGHAEIDINMGCPAPKVASSGGGALLMKNPTLAADIVREVVKASTVPVTVKMRAGWDDNNINAVELAKMCEDAGASAITVHGRTKVQMYAPPVNTNIIRQVKSAVTIPVIGNGDVVDGKSAAKMMEETGCDMVMVGRGALGRPWVFAEINAYLDHEVILPEPPVAQRMAVMLRHIEKICQYKGEFVGIREARKHAAWYTKGLHGAANYRARIGLISSIEELQQIALELVEQNP